jgi:hypothetical protein
MLKNCFLTFILLFLCSISFGQNLQKMQVWQDSLYKIGQNVFAQTAEVERIESNFLFVKTLVSALKEPNSYFYDFHKLNMISAVRSPDDSFRIFTWNVPLQDGSYLYYGSIQFKSGTLKLIPLLDKTFEIADIHTNELNNSVWYGAQYYEIVPFRPNQYLLLGWKGHDAIVSKKVIEVLTIDPQGKVKLGATIFSDKPKITRKIFTYAKQATMLLQYNKNDKRIEFDHLIPLEGGKKDQNVPDMSHDAYVLRKSDLVLQEDITILNLEH